MFLNKIFGSCVIVRKIKLSSSLYCFIFGKAGQLYVSTSLSDYLDRHVVHVWGDFWRVVVFSDCYLTVSALLELAPRIKRTSEIFSSLHGFCALG